MNNRYKNSTHFSYNDYKQKVKKHGNKDITVFISVFIIGLLIILGFVKILSPNVDVGIASNDEFSMFEDDNTYQSSVDERLKHFQDEDAGINGDTTMFSPDLDEKVVLPKQMRKTVGQMEAEMQDAKVQEEKAKDPSYFQKESDFVKKAQSVAQKAQKEVFPQTPQEPQQPSAPAPTHSAIVNAKVVVGYYATDKQAEVAKSIIQDAGLGVTPVVKNMGSYYTLQVGAYSSQEKAQQAANNLLKSNFPARVIVE